MDPISIAAIAANFAPQAIKMISGYGQKNKADDIELQDPTYNIPSSILKSTSLARERTLRDQIPGQQLREDKINESLGTAAEVLSDTATSSSEVLSGASQLQKNNINASRQLGMDVLEYKDGTELDYMASLDRFARYQDKAFEINKMRPYNEDFMAKGALYGAGAHNMYSGFSNMSGMLSSIFMNQDLFASNSMNNDRSTGLSLDERFLDSDINSPMNRNDVLLDYNFI